jgi:hypothetical protein
MSMRVAITISKFFVEKSLYEQKQVGGACAVAQGRTMPFFRRPMN